MEENPLEAKCPQVEKNSSAICDPILHSHVQERPTVI